MTKHSKYLENAHEISNKVNLMLKINANTKENAIGSDTQNESFSLEYVKHIYFRYLIARIIAIVMEIKMIFMIQL